MSEIAFQHEPKYSDYLLGHKLNDQNRKHFIFFLLILLGVALIYLELQEDESDLFSIGVGVLFILYAVLRPIIFNYKIKKRWNNRYKSLELEKDNYLLGEDGIQVQNKEGAIKLKWTDFKEYKKNKKVINLYFTNSTDWLTLPIYYLDDKTKSSVIKLIKKNVPE